MDKPELILLSSRPGRRTRSLPSPTCSALSVRARTRTTLQLARFPTVLHTSTTAIVVVPIPCHLSTGSPPKRHSARRACTRYQSPRHWQNWPTLTIATFVQQLRFCWRTSSASCSKKFTEWLNNSGGTNARRGPSVLRHFLIQHVYSSAFASTGEP